VPFREPLIPAGPLPTLAFAGPAAAPPVAHVDAARILDDEQAHRLAAALAAHERGAIVCGPRPGRIEPDALAGLARRLGWPVLADPLSDLRFALPADVQADAYDLLLRDPERCRRLAPDAVLHVGGLPVSKALSAMLAASPPALYVRVAAPGAWPDPLHLASTMVHAPAGAVVRAVGAALPAARRASPWQDEWIDASRRVRAAVDGLLAVETRFFESKVLTDTIAALPDGAVLHVGNSMPVRDLDTFAGPAGRHLRIACNRGANGIDGVLSTALGAAAVASAPVALVVGDLSFLHDAAGLQIAARHGIDATVVVVSNDGGGVFSFLPEAGYGAVFERCFGTPHGLDLARVAGACGADVRRVDRSGDLGPSLARALATPGLSVVEVPSSRDANVALHREYDAAALAALAAGGEGRMSA
jgi:2-succinyl-5-enolpyruvyl-6-hydroxy-3-cyclohexene-1-carboxylate synthase